MPVALTDDHARLAESVRAFVARHAEVTGTRALLPQYAAGGRPAHWKALVAQGLHRIHLEEATGGDGGTLVDLAVVVEEAGNGLLPGPFLPTVCASAVVAAADETPRRGAVLRAFADGATGAVALPALAGPGGISARRTDDGWELTGRSGPVMGLLSAELVLIAAATGPGAADDGPVWFALSADAVAGARTREEGVDLTRDVGRLRPERLRVSDEDRIPGVDAERARATVVALYAAEASGVVARALRTAVEYVKVREQFGRPVGSFQAVKHKAARLLLATELSAAVAWDAARGLAQDDTQARLASAAAAVVALGRAADTVLEALTLLGGIGFTWEHDIHLSWRRAIGLAALTGPTATWTRRLGSLSLATERSFDLGELEGEDPGFRAWVRERLAAAAALPPDVPRRPDGWTKSGTGPRRTLLADSGLAAPHWPRPYGLDASPAHQVVIAQEFAAAGLERPSSVVGEWAVPTILAHGNEAQRKRFAGPTLRGELVWCQLFSEPGAGSDLAGLATRAVRADGGWRVNGQKVWTSSAHEADWGLCLARTDPDAAKHRGLSLFLVDMAAPGIDVRPLRQATGDAEFNEVFLTDVFVPDDCLLGTPGQGWRLTATTLANERVTIGSGMGATHDVLSRLRDALRAGALQAEEPDVLAATGELAADHTALEALGLRATLRRLSGLEPGAASSLLKLGSALADRRAAAVGLDLLGADGALNDDPHGLVTRELRLPSVLIGGGTVEIQLNVIAERILGLPR